MSSLTAIEKPANSEWKSLDLLLTVDNFSDEELSRVVQEAKDYASKNGYAEVSIDKKWKGNTFSFISIRLTRD